MTANATTEELPYETFFQKSIFADYNGNLKFDNKELLRKHKTKYQRNAAKNKNRGKKLRINQYVYVKNFDQDKISSTHSGPFKIIEIAKNQSHVFIDKNNK
ncbi:hypothetical protein DMUE_3028 [Dictyocoela muelleri]|nr:hypothetical protein DMUE_3028 [Dictyocoela muelleri]